MQVLTYCYTIIGLVNPVIKMMIDTHNDWYIDDELLDILDEAIQSVKDDEEFHEGWDDVRELEKNIKEYEKQLESYRNTLKNYTKIKYKRTEQKFLLVFI